MKKGEEFVIKNKSFEALKYLDRAIELDPEEPLFYVNRSEAQLQLGNLSKAMEDADKVIWLRPDWPKGYKKRGDVFYRQAKYDEAAQIYATALQLDPTNETLQKDLNNAVQEGVKLRYKTKAEEEQKKKKEEEQKKKKEEVSKEPTTESTK